MNEGSLDFASFVSLVIAAFEAAGVEYMIGGAVAAWAWGEPRATLDLDLVAHIPLQRAADLSRELEIRGMLVPKDLIHESVLETRADVPINAIHARSGFKADIYPIRAHDELRRSAWNRRRLVDLGPELGSLMLHSPEDLILYKLWYFGLGRQTKHTRDIASIIATVGDELDTGYIARWADRLGLSALWEEILYRMRPT